MIAQSARTIAYAFIATAAITASFATALAAPSFAIFLPTEGNWANPACWNTQNPPNYTNFAFVIGGDTAVIDRDVPRTANIFVGQGNGDGTVVMNSGTLTATSLFLGRDSGHNGAWTQNGGTLTLAPNETGIDLADAATAKAALVIGGGAIVGVNQINDGASGVGTVTINGGALNAAGLNIAKSATASGSSFSQTGGTAVFSNAVHVGSAAGSGTLTVTGGDFSWLGTATVESGSVFAIGGATPKVHFAGPPAATALTVNDGGKMEFDLALVKSAALDLGQGKLSLGPKSILVVDGSKYGLRGAGTKTYVIVTHGGYASAPTFGQVVYTGFTDDKPSVSYTDTAVTLTVELH